MKRNIFPNSIITLLSVFAGIFFAGCREDVAPAESGPVGSMVSLTFNLDSGMTRGDGHPEWGDDDSTSKLYEGWIHVYIHDAETDELKLHLTDGKASSYGTILTEKLGEGKFKVELSTRNLTPGRKYRLSVMANCQDPEGNLYTVASPFRNTSEDKTFLQKPHFTPFSGFRTFILDSQAEESSEQILSDIKMMRSASRIDVVLGDEMKDKWKIGSALLPGFGNKLYAYSYASPKLENIRDVDGTEDLSMEQIFNPYTTVKMTDPAGEDIMLRDVNDDGTSFRIYLPEQANPLEGEELYIKLNLQHLRTGQDIEAKLYIRDLTGVSLNLVRNHIYRYTIRTVKPLFDVDVAIISPQQKEIDVPSFN
ncbi:MAG: hypothetical protein K2H46_06580 [Muribaculaceae bacterium]|nr:hypothetical protein [Muribaculaceae bacterium]